jgi:hypothetical protein
MTTSETELAAILSDYDAQQFRAQLQSLWLAMDAWFKKASVPVRKGYEARRQAFHLKLREMIRGGGCTDATLKAELISFQREMMALARRS